MKITVKSKINKKQVQTFNTFTGQLRCFDVLTLDQLFTGIYRPTKMLRCSDLGSVV